jgi:hypothetical protein
MRHLYFWILSQTSNLACSYFKKKKKKKKRQLYAGKICVPLTFLLYPYRHYPLHKNKIGSIYVFSEMPLKLFLVYYEMSTHCYFIYNIFPQFWWRLLTNGYLVVVSLESVDCSLLKIPPSLILWWVNSYMHSVTFREINSLHSLSLSPILERIRLSNLLLLKKKIPSNENIKYHH